MTASAPVTDRKYHDPVLCDDATRLLITDEYGVYVDGTVGGGGHAEIICGRLRGAGRLICFDADVDAIEHSRRRLQQFGERALFVHSNVRHLAAELTRLGVGPVCGLLLDLGVSSFQLDQAPRGFSFRSDQRLDMRMDQRQTLSAWEVVNTYDERTLAQVLWNFGEERHSRRIAHVIAGARPVNSTGDLKECVRTAVGERFLTKSLARVFQAIRIEVNGELRSLEAALADGLIQLRPGGRLVVIAYHSLEDRIVKEFMRAEGATTIPGQPRYGPWVPRSPRLRILTKKPLVPGDEEMQSNPRARSAKLRAAERLPG